MRHLHLLRSDDPHSGIVSRSDIRKLTRLIIAIGEDHPEEARELWEITRRIRSTIPYNAWSNPDLNFPKADPAIGFDPVG